MYLNNNWFNMIDCTLINYSGISMTGCIHHSWICHGWWCLFILWQGRVCVVQTYKLTVQFDVGLSCSKDKNKTRRTTN